jgi:hypothetical protein
MVMAATMTIEARVVIMCPGTGDSTFIATYTAIKVYQHSGGTVDVAMFDQELQHARIYH